MPPKPRNKDAPPKIKPMLRCKLVLSFYYLFWSETRADRFLFFFLILGRPTYDCPYETTHKQNFDRQQENKHWIISTDCCVQKFTSRADLDFHQRNK